MADLQRSLNQICTFLAEGNIWHGRAADELRKMPNRRGYARMHESQAAHDARVSLDLHKDIRDILHFTPALDMAYAGKAAIYVIQDFNAFKRHFGDWENRENAYHDAAFEAIEAVRGTDIQIYTRMCQLARHFQEEAWRAAYIFSCLDEEGWGKHHVAVVSKWLHDHDEARPGSLDFNIG